MGSPTTEAGRVAIEGPMQRVTVQPFALAKYEVTVGEYRQFVQETGYQQERDCWPEEHHLTWEDPGFPQTTRDPVVCVSFNDASAYIDWLNARADGSPYRLPSEAEWEYAARAGKRTAYSWGGEADEGCAFANGAGLVVKDIFGGDWTPFNCNDGYDYTAPVGSFAPNAFGLHDMHGNALEWTEDCYRDNLSAQTGSPWRGDADCLRVLRGGSWLGVPRGLRSADRYYYNYRSVRSINFGFRVARTLD